ncbi:hypothetical protein BFP97_10810 [Roseivirga sp. 4D4]|uniref:hypothetical protein n=1 Tax=Roseivirga sp. 4D4 TaxID=1889784 RepID=UPI000852D75A|nr:hypothetical protein [Roseivirga sp. 4D4]OEK01978.1 hypothetical protein BFP97_10810 [Roseivirga sp. 4D4]
MKKIAYTLLILVLYTSAFSQTYTQTVRIEPSVYGPKLILNDVNQSNKVPIEFRVNDVIKWEFGQRPVGQNHDLALWRYNGSYTRVMTWDQLNGNVGIGTDSPNDRLSVVGQNVSFLSNTTYNTMKFGRNSTERLQFQVEDNNAYLEYFQDSDNNGAHIFHIRNRADGSSPDNDIRFSTGGQQRLSIKDNGNVGIGTTTPGEKLEVNGNTKIDGDLYQVGQARMTTGSNFLRVTADNDAPIRVKSNDGWVGIGFEDPAGSSYIYFEGNKNQFHIQSKAKISGDAIVNGDVEAMKVKVSVNPGNWPDYVFASSYELRALSEVEDFVKKNGHLPEVPSAEKVEKEGLDLGNMDATLLKKVEELTLYMIDMKKEIEVLKEENKRLSNEVKKVKK